MSFPPQSAEADTVQLWTVKAWRDYNMEAQDGLKMIVPPLFLNIFFYFLLV